MKIKILQKYLIAEFLKYFVIALLGLIFFYITVDFISNIGAFTKHSPHFKYIIIYFFYKLPEIAYRVLPLSTLLSTLLSISFFNKNNEITAIKSSGLSMLRFFAPLIILGSALSVSAFFLSNFVAVQSNISRRVVMQKYINKNKSYNEGSVYKYATKNIFIHYKKCIVTAKAMDPSSKIIKGVNVYVFNKKFRLLKRYTAETGRFGKNGLALTAGQEDYFGFKKISRGFVQTYFKTVKIPIYLNLNFFRTYTLKPEFLSIISLSEMVSVAKKSESGLSYILTSYYSKISFPIINLILILIGISIGLMLGKKGNSPVSIGISLVFAFTWWIINSISLSLGESAQLNPMLSAFMADIIFFSFALYFIMDLD
jgi:lipopolysaccharide export system permease protein